MSNSELWETVKFDSAMYSLASRMVTRLPNTNTVLGLRTKGLGFDLRTGLSWNYLKPGYFPFIMEELWRFGFF